MRWYERGVLRAGRVVVAVIFCSGWLAAARPVSAEPAFVDGAFRTFWVRTDLLPEQGVVKRTYIWGPPLLTAPDGPRLPRTEPYRESETGQRTVQYFEKGRMELAPGTAPASSTAPTAARVTAGLLVKEMVGGLIQIGGTQTQQFAPAGVPVVGDPANNPAPTYAALAPLATLTEGSHTAPDRTGQRLDGALDAKGTAVPLTGVAEPTTYAYHVRETGHNIAAPFWQFLTQDAPTLNERGAVAGGKLFEPPFFAVGLPITEPYWTRATVGGQMRDVLIQAFERRILSFTPANPDGFKVEMGNVGTAYTRWRYGPAAEPPAVAAVEPKAAATGSLLLVTAAGFAPDEPVVLRLTYPDGKTVERSGGTAEVTGISRATLETNAKEFPPGMYKAEMIGTRGTKAREGAFTLIAPPTNGLIVQAVPNNGDALTLFTFYTSGLTPGNSVNVTVSGPMGGVFPVGGTNRAHTVGERGTLTFTLVPKSLNTEVLVGPWAFIVQEPGNGGRQASAPFIVNAPPRAGA